MPKISEKENQKPYLACECDKIGETAISYGFSVVTAPHIAPEDISKAKQFKEFDIYEDCEEKVALMKWFEQNSLASEPLPMMVHYKKPLHGSAAKKKPSEEMYGFEIMGSTRSTSEAVLIKTALSLLSDLGYKDLYVDINSMGDKESIAKFDRELGSYYRKHGSELPAKMRESFKKNPYLFLANNSPESEVFVQGAPQTIATLSDLSRAHFKEVLEYLESFDCVYKIRHNLLSNKTFASGTVFEIRQMTENPKEDSLLAYGYRYNYLAKKIGGKKDVPSVGLTVIVKKTDIASKKVVIKKLKKPCLYLVQLGSTAKLKALNVVETLRKNRITICHSITKDKIGGQLSGADYMHASHLLIIGQKEAIENTVVVRNAVTREQETVCVSELAEFLKQLDKGTK